MSFFGKPRGMKYSSRTLEMDTYQYDDERLVIAGCLTDRRMKEFTLATGIKMQPGILHKIVIELLVNKVNNLEIEDVHLKLCNVPNGECLGVMHILSPLKGVRIGRGFKAKVRELAGGKKGCVHIVELLSAMAASTIQGYYAARTSQEALPKAEVISILGNTCWAWREEGTLVRELREQMEDEK